MSNQGNRGGGRGNGGGNDQRRADQEQRALTVIDPPRMPLPAAAQEQGITIERWRALIDAVYPAAKTLAGVMLALDYCKARNLDPFKRVVHVVPMWNSKLGREVETVWPGIGELRTTASRTGLHAGNDDCVFGRVLRQAFSDSRTGSGNNGPYSTNASCPEMDFPEWAQITVYKIVAGQRVPFVGPKVYFVETFSGEKGLRVPNARWRQAPRQMLEKCAEAAALRRAFPEELGDSYSAEEMEGQRVPPADAENAQAKYHYVDAEEADGGAREQQQEQRQPDREEHRPRELNGWKEARLDHYMNGMRSFFAEVTSLDRLDQVVEDERRKVDTLPDAEKREAKDLERVARERLDKPGRHEGDRGGDQQQRDEAPSGGGEQDGGDDSGVERVEDADWSPEEQEDPPFVRNFRRRVAEVELLVDLDNLERTEKRAIDQRPGLEARICDRILANRRAELQR